MNKIDSWIFYHLCWLKMDNVHIVRFEDYKTNPKKQLQEILDFCDIHTSEIKMDKALKNSTPELSRIAEANYLDLNDLDTTCRINKGSIVNNYRLHEELADDMQELHKKSLSMMQLLGYTMEHSNEETLTLHDFVPFALKNPFFKAKLSDLILNEREYTDSHSNYPNILLQRVIDFWNRGLIPSQQDGGQYYLSMPNETQALYILNFIISNMNQSIIRPLSFSF